MRSCFCNPLPVSCLVLQHNSAHPQIYCSGQAMAVFDLVFIAGKYHDSQVIAEIYQVIGCELKVDNVKVS